MLIRMPLLWPVDLLLITNRKTRMLLLGIVNHLLIAYRNNRMLLLCKINHHLKTRILLKSTDRLDCKARMASRARPLA